MQYLLQSATYTANNYQVQARKPFRVAPECLENPNKQSICFPCYSLSMWFKRSTHWILVIIFIVFSLNKKRISDDPMVLTQGTGVYYWIHPTQ